MGDAPKAVAKRIHLSPSFGWLSNLGGFLSSRRLSAAAARERKAKLAKLLAGSTAGIVFNEHTRCKALITGTPADIPSRLGFPFGRLHFHLARTMAGLPVAVRRTGLTEHLGSG